MHKLWPIFTFGYFWLFEDLFLFFPEENLGTSTVYSISGKLCSKYLCHRDDDVVFNESKMYSINRNTIFSNVRWAICSDTHRFSFEIFHRVEHYVHYNLLTPSFDSFGNMSSILSSSWITNTWALIYGRPSFFSRTLIYSDTFQTVLEYCDKHKDYKCFAHRLSSQIHFIFVSKKLIKHITLTPDNIGFHINIP